VLQENSINVRLDWACLFFAFDEVVEQRANVYAMAGENLQESMYEIVRLWKLRRNDCLGNSVKYDSINKNESFTAISHFRDYQQQCICIILQLTVFFLEM
jgi:hypothetical protein